ncbi:hypothetical protein Tco_0974565 [Tanacetum coccineum]|uniref:Uncharacterized protein n=1 Tax=Tanacetum coccineum TaxID=301880 RepID=A0ABQ5EBX4_9ASTR
MQNYTRYDAQSFYDAMIFNMDSLGKYMLELILHQQRTPQLLKQKKLMQTQEDHSHPIPALNVDSLKVDLVVIQNTCSEKEDSNSETASSKLVKECSLNSETKDVHAIKYKMSKAKERCMAYFRSLHSHLQVLSKDDLKGTRIEHGFKRAFMSIFGQDVDTFTRTMLLNVDQLQKQLDKDEFQEDGSITAFWVVNNQFQKFIDSKFTLDYDSQMTDTYFVEYTGLEVQHFRDTLLQYMGNVKKSVVERTCHQRQYERRGNKTQMQTQESKIDTGKALDNGLVVMESNGTESEVQDDSSRSGNDTDADDADIRPIYDEEPMAEIQENVFAIAALKNDLRKLKGNSVDTKFDKTSVLGKPVLQSLRNQSVVRQPNAFKSARAQMSKQRFASQVDVNKNLSKPVTQHYLPKKTESAFAKPDHVIASSSSRNSSKNMPRFSSNDMVHNHYLDEARKKTQERDRNSKTSVMLSARFQSTADGSKPKPRRNNQTSRSLPVSKSSRVTITAVPKADHSKSSSSFSDSKQFVCSTCHKCVFNANHDACITKLLKEVNSRAKVPSNKTTNRNKPVEQIRIAKKPERQIPTGHRFSIKKTSAVHEKTMTLRSCLRWKPTGKIFRTVGLRWVPTGKIFTPSTTKVDSEPPNGSNADITNQYESAQTLDVSAGTSNLSAGHRFSPNKTSAVSEKTSPRSDLRWKPTGRIFKSVGLRWIPTGKLFDSCTSKVDSEPPHGSNVDIPHIHECKQTLDSMVAEKADISETIIKVDSQMMIQKNDVCSQQFRPRSSMSNDV